MKTWQNYPVKKDSNNNYYITHFLKEHYVGDYHVIPNDPMGVYDYDEIAAFYESLTEAEMVYNAEGDLVVQKQVVPASTPTLEDLKILKIERLKIERDHREVDKIVYNDNIFDFDDKARERMRIARADLLSSNVSERLWTCADDKVVSLSVLDFDNINSLAATRSEQLHFQYRKLKIVVQQCKTLEALEHINFDTDCSHVEVEVTNG